jgi:predicted ATPase/DNA-binding winged helix-turn-helix (wHTH) protein
MSAVSVYAFGAFRLVPDQRLLVCDGAPVKLGSRAFDLLLALVERHERVVPKQELLDLVWPHEDIGEANLAVHVMALRKLLGRTAIATVPGRGYRFTLPLAAAGSGEATAPPLSSSRHNLPARSDELLGRATEVRTLLDLVARHPLVCVIGPGGVGKTRLAQHVAARLRERFAAGVWWIELAPLSDASMVAAAVAQVLRVSHAPQRDAVAAVASVLRASPALLVLDNGEHVVEGIVALASALRQHAPEAQLLVTSQEPLRLPSEQVMRLEPLDLPIDDSLEGARHSGAVGLFEARARLVAPGFELQSTNRAAVVEICSRLDGIPLAIELAAARLPLLGLEGLRLRLGERLKVLASHARAHLPRHQTLRATLDWSHGLLDESEQRLLRRLGVFAGGFTLVAAQQVAQDETLDEWGVLESLGGLVDRSIVVSDGQPVPRFRLLETTRLYALERLTAAEEQASLREAHARTMDRLLRVERDDERLWRTPPAAVPSLVAELDNTRAALDWAQTCTDDALAISLAAGASHVFLTASLNAEYLQRVLPFRARALSSLPPRTVGLFWARIALACSRNAHPAGLEAALNAAQVYRAIAEPGRLYDALTWALAIGSRHGRGLEAQGLVEEAERLEQPDWPPALRSSYQWAKYRWLQSQGRAEEALQCASAQAELLAQAGNWATHVAVGANVADCELSLGRLEHAEALARRSLDALDAMGIDENLVGHVMDMLMVALALQGRADEALVVARRALRLLLREGDELRLLDTLALNATTGGHWADAARIAGHVEAAMAATGERRWPSAQRRRQQLERRLEAALGAEAMARHMAEGHALTREEAFQRALREIGPS